MKCEICGGQGSVRLAGDKQYILCGRCAEWYTKVLQYKEWQEEMRKEAKLKSKRAVIGRMFELAKIEKAVKEYEQEFKIFGKDRRLKKILEREGVDVSKVKVKCLDCGRVVRKVYTNGHWWMCGKCYRKMIKEYSWHSVWV